MGESCTSSTAEVLVVETASMRTGGPGTTGRVEKGGGTKEEGREGKKEEKIGKSRSEGRNGMGEEDDNDILSVYNYYTSLLHVHSQYKGVLYKRIMTMK